MMNMPIEFRKLTPDWKYALTNFLNAINEAGDEKFFHPHPFTPEEIEKVVQYKGKDLYYIVVENEQILAYGMLRGWDQGYTVPSLVIAIHPSVRGIGLGRLFMMFLHFTAKHKGAKNVRLKVYSENKAALKLYQSLGYIFTSEENGQLVGYLDLS